MKYISVAEARGLKGLRLVLTSHIPGAYGEAAKAILKIRGLDYIPVEQRLLEENKELREWTGVRNAPVAVYDDEPALTTWLEILMLAERLGSGPSLLPADPLERALALGLSTEILGRDGLSWCVRVLLQSPRSQTNNPTPVALSCEVVRNYGVSPEAIANAPGRILSILKGFATQLGRQQKIGSEYLVGDRLSACDVYWACFSNPLLPLAHEDCPMPDWMRARFNGLPPEIRAAIDPALIRHRDMIFRRHIGLPLVF